MLHLFQARSAPARLLQDLRASSKIPRKRIERDQKDCKQDHQRYSSAALAFRLFQQVSNCGAEKEHLDGSHQTRGDFHQGKLVNERKKENRATRHRGRQTQNDRKNGVELVSFLHFFAFALCFFREFQRGDTTPGPESHFIVAEDAILDAQ
jgi:hypothetical protein